MGLEVFLKFGGGVVGFRGLEQGAFFKDHGYLQLQ